MKLGIMLLFVAVLVSCTKSGKQADTLVVSLMSPGENGTVKAGFNAEFRWSSSASDGSTPVLFGIKIVEILQDQSPVIAIRTNKPFFEKDSIKDFLITVAPSAGSPGLLVDKKYAWQVVGNQKSLSSNSPIFSFRVVP